MSKPVQIEVVLSHSEHLPAVDVWLVIDILRATTVIVRWFELGGGDLYPTDSVESAALLAERLREKGETPLLMGEQNAIAPEGFDLGNSPLDLREELIRNHSCAVMATTNGTRALVRAASTGTPVLVACARNALSALDLALCQGRRIGIFCSGRRGRPAWDDTLCAGLLISRLREVFPDIHLADSARLAYLTWKNSGDFGASLASADHAVFLDKIGFREDIAFAAEIGIARTVPELREIPEGEGMRACLREGLKDPAVYSSDFGLLLESAFARTRDLSSGSSAFETNAAWHGIVRSGTGTEFNHLFLAGKGFRKQYRNRTRKS